LFGIILSLLLAVPPVLAQVDNDSASNAQDGDDEDGSDQSGEADSGDAVVGQVVGVTSSGDASVDATNRTEDSSAESGDVEGSNQSASAVGLFAGNASPTNVQEGDNTAQSVQAADTNSGDAVAGQIAGVTTSPSGSADLVLANTTIEADVETGDAEFDNDAISFVGLFGPGSGGAGLVLNISDATTSETGTLAFVVSVSRTSRSKSVKAAKSAKAGAEPENPPPGEGSCGATFTYASSDGSATSNGFSGSTGNDYAPDSGSGTIPCGQQSTTLTISTNDDDSQDCEGNEAMHLKITGASIPVGDGDGVGTITEDAC
jgi:hypothetical protein